ncbi:MFS transporter [Pseudoalteromonas sp. HL-AS2]|jgi:ACS family hexuronate transporter-like MFS transporter|uniref:Hexuronate transport protein (MFS family) n=3 Tax=Gammaproteobacteria TaxID=1236 RepID=Q3IH57_PSET1|nr:MULTISPECIES: MFS transporter [Pseudoalteromonas]MBB1404622.1 MFS transporter [Pseudoalteromonas sp. SG44-5]MBH0073177.1 MFS transporter [Pseudoalteromonas sp. NZS127]MBH0092978.1 MFS transporter [Pseudoalteromonas sp. SCQQ13]WMS93348.1 MFS transporter [Pseudoalteromonas sp. HL-AS2]CAI86818.1 putative hexuronate transport protein (MFS family) [Pseudoalteromonas translucida]|tara:strand:+ start:8896 stop:10203 length:1308 start_codon:yes stop_codon:yes gene_type:complete
MQLKGLRWWVIALIALATIINYIDRQALSVLWPDIVEDLFPDESALERKQIYANISIVFVFSYAFGQAIFGKIFDWVGTRLGFVLSIGVWSLATIAHAFAQGVLSFSFFRAILGVAEAGNWPGAAKGNAEWFPTKERALAQGIFNSGAAIGGIIAIPLIAYLTIYFSWQMVFVAIGVLGFLWLVPWLILVKAPPSSHPWLTAQEREYILTGQRRVDDNGDVTDEEEEEYNPSTAELLCRKQSWGVIIASAAIDPIWWLFVFWIPIYLNEVYGMDVKSIGIYGWVPYVGAMFGAWFGGLLAQNRLKSGWNTDKTRKLTITLGCLIMLPALLAMANPGGPVTAVLIMAVILFGFQTAIGNVQTLPSDLLGKKAVGTLSGFSGMAAKLGAVGLTSLVPILTADGNYAPAFIIGASLAIIAMAAVWILIPKIEPLKKPQ